MTGEHRRGDRRRTNVVTPRRVAKDAAATETPRAVQVASPTRSANRVIGTDHGRHPTRRAGRPQRGRNAAGEQPMGDVIADALFAATAPSDFGGAVVAFMNPGGVRGEPALQPDQRWRAARRGHIRRGLRRAAVRQHAGREDVHRPAALRRARAAVRESGRRAAARDAGRRTACTYSFTRVVRAGQQARPTRLRSRSDGVAVDPRRPVVPGRDEQLHRRRRRRIHRLQVVHRTRSAATWTSTPSALPARTHSPVAPPPLNRITRLDRGTR